jgi:hypothetical protein
MSEIFSIINSKICHQIWKKIWNLIHKNVICLIKYFFKNWLDTNLQSAPSGAISKCCDWFNMRREVVQWRHSDVPMRAADSTMLIDHWVAEQSAFQCSCHQSWGSQISDRIIRMICLSMMEIGGRGVVSPQSQMGWAYQYGVWDWRHTTAPQSWTAGVWIATAVWFGYGTAWPCPRVECLISILVWVCTYTGVACWWGRAETYAPEASTCYEI